MRLNNKTIRKAVSDWIKNKGEAEVIYGHIANWDTSGVTDMSKLFLDAPDFNDPIGSWNVSNVTTMNAMFDNAYKFNQDLSIWEISNVKYKEDMFMSIKGIPLDFYPREK